MPIGSTAPVVATSIFLAGACGALIGFGYVYIAAALLGALWMVVAYSVSPAFVMMAFVSTRPLVDAFVHVQVGSVSVGQLWGGVLVALLLVHGLRVRLGSSTAAGAAFVPVLFLVLYAFASLTRPGFSLAIGNLLKLASWILLMLSVGEIASKPKGQRLVVNSAYVFAVLVLVSIAYAWMKGAYGSVSGGQVVAGDVTQGPHGLSFMALFSLPLVLAYPLAGRRGFASSVLALCLMGAAIMSFVRTALVVLVVFGLIYVVSVIRWRNVRGFMAVTLGAAIVSAIAWAYRGVFAARFEDIAALVSGQSPASGAGSGRIAIWGSIVEGSIQSPSALFVGNGATGSRSFVAAATGMQVGGHADLLDLLATGGVFLVASYVALIAWMGKSFFSVLRGSGQSKNARRFAVLGLAGAMGFVIVGVINGAMFYQASLLLAMSVGLFRGMSQTPGNTFLDEGDH